MSGDCADDLSVSAVLNFHSEGDHGDEISTSSLSSNLSLGGPISGNVDEGLTQAEIYEKIKGLSDLDLELTSANLINCEDSKVMLAICVNSEIVYRHEARGVSSSSFLSYIDALLLLADLYARCKDYRSAYLCRERVLRIHKQFSSIETGQHKSFLIQFLNGITLLARQAGDLDHAAAYAVEAMNTARGFFGDFHADYASTLVSLAQVFASKKEYLQCIELLEAAVNIYRSLEGNQSSNTINAKSMLAVALRMQAQQALERSEYILRENSNDDNSFIYNDNSTAYQLTETKSQDHADRDTLIHDHSSSIANLSEDEEIVQEPKNEIQYYNDGIQRPADADSLPSLPRGQPNQDNKQQTLAVKSIQKLPYKNPYKDVNYIDGYSFHITLDQKMIFSVNYVPLPSDSDLRPYLGRENDVPYKSACGKEFSLPVFSSPLLRGEEKTEYDEDKYRYEFITLSSYNVSMRIRRIVLDDETKKLTSEIKRLKGLQELIYEKKEFYIKRIKMLESELAYVAETSEFTRKSNTFNGLLTLQQGWHLVHVFLQREYKRRQSSLHSLHQSSDADSLLLPPTGNRLRGEVPPPLQVADIKFAWELLQEILICRSLEIRCVTGLANYPKQAGPGPDARKTPADTTGGGGGGAVSFVVMNDNDHLGDQVSLLSNPTFAENIDDNMDEESANMLELVREEVVMNGGSDPNQPQSGLGTEVLVQENLPTDANVEHAMEDGGIEIGTQLHSNANTKAARSKASHKSSVLTLQPAVDGECFANWDAVCNVVGTTPYRPPASATALQQQYVNYANYETSLYFVVGSFMNRLRENSSLMESIPLSLISDVLINLNDLSPEDDQSPVIAKLLTKVSDLIAERLHGILILHLRLLPQWVQMLEALRKARLKSLGGKVMSSNDDMSVEVDAYGIPRSIPNADEVVDTDLLHGTMQRVKLDVAMPEVKKRLDAATDKRFALRGELACLLQIMFSMNAPYIQRLFRGAIGRQRAAKRLRNLVYQAMHASVTTIALWIRAIKARERFQAAKLAALGNLQDEAAVVIQRFSMSWTKWSIHQRYKREKRNRLTFFAVSKFQALIRGFLSRHRLQRQLAQNKDAALQEVKVWSAVGIQKLARGYIARKTIVKSLRTRRLLSKGVLKLAERFLHSGDLWGFLKEVDDEFARSQNELKEHQDRENEWAATFVEKVLARREDQFDNAWNQFSQSVGSYSSSDNAHVRDHVNSVADDDFLSADGFVNSSMIDRNVSANIGSREPSRILGKFSLSENSSDFIQTGVPGSVLSASSPMKTGGTTRGDATIASRLKSRSKLDSGLQGPLLRRAVTATVQQGVNKELDRIKKGESRSAKLVQDIRNVYGGNSSVKSSASIASGKSSNSMRKVSADGSGALNESEIRLQLKLKRKNTANQIKGKISASSSDWTSHASNDQPSGSQAESSHVDLHQPSPGEYLLLDIPLGLEDTIERLMKAAAIRCYIPEFFTSGGEKETDAAYAYSVYLKMPQGLAKMRYEQEAWKWAQGHINQLKIKGLKHISDLLPMTRFRNYLSSVNTPVILINKCVDLYWELKHMGTSVAGMSHPTTDSALKKIKEGEVPISQEIAAIKAELRDRPVQIPMESSMSMDESTPQSIDETLSNRLLVSMVEKGPWIHLSSPIDELFLHAAYLVIPFVPYLDAAKNDNTATSPGDSDDRELGHFAFKDHIRELQNLTSEEDRKECVKSRFRSALIFVTPYTLKLKSMGVFTNMDLIKFNLPDLQMPSMFQSQVESLLSVAVSLAASARTAPTVRDHLATGKELFEVAMLYDPKFQRSPFDPFGRPSRLLPLSEVAKKKKRKDAAAASSSSRQHPGGVKKLAPIVYPGGIWGKDQLNNGMELLGLNEEEEEQDGSPRNSSDANLWKFQSTDDSQKPSHHGHLPDASEAPPKDINLANRPMNYTISSQNPSSALSLQENSSLDAPRLMSRSVDGFGIDSRVNTAASRPPTVKEMQKKNSLYKRDFEAKLRSGFERPFACQYRGCHQAFSRLYTLKVHEKSHELFSDYHIYKKQPQLFYDPDVETIKQELDLQNRSEECLPSLVQQDLLALQLTAEASRGSLASSGLAGISSSSNSRLSTAMATNRLMTSTPS